MMVKGERNESIKADPSYPIVIRSSARLDYLYNFEIVDERKRTMALLNDVQKISFQKIIIALLCCMPISLSQVCAFSPNSSSPTNQTPQSSPFATNKTRRNTINTFIGSFASVFFIPNQISKSSSVANALPFINTKEKRQLELCLVSILRIKYWAENVALSIATNIENQPATGMTDLLKGPYLEARLGAKSILTGKIGGGANSKVYTLSSFKIKECINDALYYYNENYNSIIKDKSTTGEQKTRLKREKNNLQNASTEIIESLAEVVEFDGLDNIQDPSPRSSLALTMYNDSKANFVIRLLLERTVVYCDVFVSSFGNEKRLFCEGYIGNTFPNEIPLSLKLSYSKGGDGVLTD